MDGEQVTANVSASDISLPKQAWAFDRALKRSHRLQLEVVGNKADWQITGRHCDYKVLDIPDAPTARRMTERTHQLALASDLGMWLSRGSNLLLDRVSGDTNAGSVVACAGPDGKSNSAMTVAGTIVLDNSAYASGCILAWYKGSQTITGAAFSINAGTSGDWKLGYWITIDADCILSTGDWFDVRMFGAVKASAARLYAFTDVTENSGRNILPKW